MLPPALVCLPTIQYLPTSLAVPTSYCRYPTSIGLDYLNTKYNPCPFATSTIWAATRTSNLSKSVTTKRLLRRPWVSKELAAPPFQALHSFIGFFLSLSSPANFFFAFFRPCLPKKARTRQSRPTFHLFIPAPPLTFLRTTTVRVVIPFRLDLVELVLVLVLDLLLLHTELLLDTIITISHSPTNI